MIHECVENLCPFVVRDRCHQTKSRRFQYIYTGIKALYWVMHSILGLVYTVKCVVSGKIYTAGKSFTLPPAVTGGTNLTSEYFDWCCRTMAMMMALWPSFVTPAPNKSVWTISKTSNNAMSPFWKDVFPRQRAAMQGTSSSSISSMQEETARIW